MHRAPISDVLGREAHNLRTMLYVGGRSAVPERITFQPSAALGMICTTSAGHTWQLLLIDTSCMLEGLMIKWRVI